MNSGLTVNLGQTVVLQLQVVMVAECLQVPVQLKWVVVYRDKDQEHARC